MSEPIQPSGTVPQPIAEGRAVPRANQQTVYAFWGKVFRGDEGDLPKWARKDIVRTPGPMALVLQFGYGLVMLRHGPRGTNEDSLRSVEHPIDLQVHAQEPPSANAMD
jgi:hypothetical protein